MHALNIPHLPTPGMCPVNGIRDLVQWCTGRDWSNEFVHGLGQGGGFAYLRINPANPPRQVYWGIATPRQHAYLAGLFNASFYELEGRSFKFAWSKARSALDDHMPPILGPLDMFHLPFYPGIYHQRHIPIHFVLLVGYDDNHAFLLDTGWEESQQISLAELELAWNVNVPGIGRHNRLVTLSLPLELEPTDRLVRKAIRDQCQSMLKPPVSMLGIPAMQKLAREVQGWPTELGDETSQRCLQQMREYLNSPPDSQGNHLTAGRDLYITFLEQAAIASGLDFSVPISEFHAVLEIIPGMARAIQVGDLGVVADGFRQVVEAEQRAFSLLAGAVSEPG